MRLGVYHHTVRLIDFVQAITRAVSTGRPPTVHRRGPCRETLWRRAFPEAAQSEVRGFLATFARAFDYPSSEKLKFRPNDTVYEVYRDRYRLAGWTHSTERKALSRLMEKRYHVALSDLWSETLTLGELFEASRTKVLDPARAEPVSSAAPQQPE